MRGEFTKGFENVELTELAAILHQHTTGASDPLSKEDLKQIIIFMWQRVGGGWKEPTSPYDRIVRNLCQEVLREYYVSIGTPPMPKKEGVSCDCACHFVGGFFHCFVPECCK